jgi:type II secretory pathway component PulF
MAFLKFEAVDASGKFVQGTLQAGTPAELEVILKRQGLQPLSIDGKPLTGAPQQVPKAPTTVPRPARPKPTQTQSPRPATTVRPVQPQVQTPIRPAPVTQAQVTNFDSPRFTNKQLLFFASQAASLFNSGMAPVNIFQHLGAQLPPIFAPMMQDMTAELTNGSSISDAMEKRPNTFSTDIVATIRAGEKSGQVGQAFNAIVLTVERQIASYKPLAYFFLMMPLLLLCAVGGIGIQNASYHTMKRQDEAGSNLPPFKTLFEELFSKGSAWLLLGIGIAVSFFLIVKLLHTLRFRRMRHTVGLRVTPGRSRDEAVERVSWAMAVQSAAGIAPSSAIHTAVSAIPNDVIRDRALAALGTMKENESLASLLTRSGVLDQQQIHMIQNSELTGDVPGALDSISRQAALSHENNTGRMRVALTSATMLLMGGFALIMTFILFKMYFQNLFKIFADQ